MNDERIEKISLLVVPILQPIGAYLVDLNIRGERGSAVVEVSVDTDAGITLDQCAEISRDVSVELENSNIITGRYRLEVSSPGLGRPLKLTRQFQKNIGRKLKIISTVGIETVGTLQEISETSLVLISVEKKPISVVLNDIQEAYVLPQFK